MAEIGKGMLERLLGGLRGGTVGTILDLLRSLWSMIKPMIRSLIGMIRPMVESLVKGRGLLESLTKRLLDMVERFIPA